MRFARFIFHVVLVIGISVTFGLAQQQATGSNNRPEDQVTQLERDWLAADAQATVRHCDGSSPTISLAAVSMAGC
jgi:hypothetical protein